MSLFTGGIAAAIGLLGIGTKGVMDSVAASKTSGAAKTAAQITADAANHAADLKATSDATALAYTQKQDAQTRADSNAAQLANYGQYAAREGRLATLGDMMGMPGRTPAPPPNFLTSSPTTPTSSTTPPGGAPSGGVPGVPASTSTSAATPQVDWTADPATLAKQIAAYYQSRGTTPAPTSVAYFVNKAQELVTRGQQLGNPNYPNERLAAADEFGGGAGSSSTSPSAATPASSASTVTNPGAQANLATLSNVLIRTPALAGPLTTGY